MYFGCKSCCGHILIMSGCSCVRSCLGTAEINAEFELPPWDCVQPGAPNGIPLVSYINQLKPQTPAVWDAAIAEVLTCPQFEGGPSKPPPTVLAGWACDNAGQVGQSGSLTCNFNLPFPQQASFTISGTAGRFGQITGRYVVTNTEGFAAEAALSSKVGAFSVPLPPGESLRSYYGVDKIRVRFVTTSAMASPLPVGFRLGPYVSETHKRVPNVGFGIECIPGDDCTFDSFGLDPISIGYGLAEDMTCGASMQELLDGLVTKDGEVRGRDDNREQIYTLQDTEAVDTRATFEKQWWSLVFYPEPLWDDALPMSGGNQVEYNFKQLIRDPACIAVTRIEFFDVRGRLLKVLPPAQ